MKIAGLKNEADQKILKDASYNPDVNEMLLFKH